MTIQEITIHPQKHIGIDMHTLLQLPVNTETQFTRAYQKVRRVSYLDHDSVNDLHVLMTLHHCQKCLYGVVLEVGKKYNFNTIVPFFFYCIYVSHT